MQIHRERYSPAVLEKARRLYESGGVRPDSEYPDVFWVRSGSGELREYRVQLYAHFASCTCKHGIHTGAGATCAHTVAAALYAGSHPFEPNSAEREAGAVQAPDEAPDGLEELVVTDGTMVKHYRLRTRPNKSAELPPEPF